MIQRNDIGYRIGESHPRGAKYPDAVVERARCMYENGQGRIGYGKISSILNVPRITVAKWCSLERRNQFSV